MTVITGGTPTSPNVITGGPSSVPAATLDLTDDYEVFDGLEIINFTSVTNSGNATITVPGTLRLTVENAERQPSQGVYTAQRVEFQLPAINVVGITPKPRDFITDMSGTIWTCLRTEPPTFNDYWGCYTLCPVIVYQLQDVITITPPSDETDAYLSPLTNVGTSITGVPCRIQFINETPDDYQGIQYMRPRYHVWTAYDVPVAIGTIFTATSGKYVASGVGAKFRIIDVKNLDRIDELAQFAVTLDPIPQNAPWL